MPSAEEITRHHDPNPDEDPWVYGPPPATTVTLVAYDRSWPDRYATLAGDILTALGDVVLDIEHVGSTAVPDLAAWDIVDIVLTVADPRLERTYVPALEAIGWQHVIRESSWHQHRALNHSEPRANLHVFGPDCPETIRLRMFRDWLRSHPHDRQRYENAKRAAVPGGGHVMDYNARKQDTIREIYDRLFRTAGLLPETAHRQARAAGPACRFIEYFSAAESCPCAARDGLVARDCVGAANWGVRRDRHSAVVDQKGTRVAPESNSSTSCSWMPR